MKVFCTKFALNSLSDIYKYYQENVSLTISQNIKDSVLSSSRQLEKQFHSGQIEELLIDLDEGHRYILRGNYKIIYKIYNHKIYITDVFDTRQNPEKIKNRKK